MTVTVEIMNSTTSVNQIASLVITPSFAQIYIDSI